MICNIVYEVRPSSRRLCPSNSRSPRSLQRRRRPPLRRRRRSARAGERGRSTSNSGRRAEHFQSWTCHLGGNTKHLLLDPPLVPEQPSCTQTTGDIHFHLYIITTNNSLIKNNQQTTDPYRGVRDTFFYFLIFNLTDKYSNRQRLCGWLRLQYRPVLQLTPTGQSTLQLSVIASAYAHRRTF